ncbi:MAG: DNA polymerase III subunit gamma/tau, partial [Clostridia bacterium]|nr:DNA polymerase III subunit gamma/tau [Clostridia bacterium]
MYLSLYRKWRPRTFDEMCGQEHITSILKKQCATGKVSHAYLFCGTRGTGKTSSAKILAKAVNCEHPIDGNPCNECESCRSIDNGSATDVLEIDAASNNRVDNVRDLRDEVVYPPSVLKKRVYIIDEVHMLTDSAFNALLKTLEEPPEYVVFILATTELNELPPTIISRCLRFDFSRIDTASVKKRIEYVAAQENIKAEDDALQLIAALADGSLRDGLSLLEAVTNGSEGKITRKDVQRVLGIAGDDTVYSILHSIAVCDIPAAVAAVEEVHRSSKDVSVFINDIAIAVRDIIIEKQLAKAGKHGELRDAFKPLIDELTVEKLFYISNILEDTQNRISKYSLNKNTVLELAVIRMCDTSLSDSPKALAARVSELERKIAVMSVMGVDSAPQEVIADKPAEEPVIIPSVQKETPVKNCESAVRFDRIDEVLDFLPGYPTLGSYFKDAEITENGDTFVIKADAYSVDMIKTDISEQELSSAFSAICGRKVKIDYEIQDN